jgi:pimeloyl-ACP methyl ester carboxylesterase
VEYSYAGPVSVDYQVGSRFHFSGPDYACPATAQDANTSVFTLRDSLDTIAGAYNGNVRFALVGHSLGGLIAVLGMSQPLVETVVTLDSPLMGVGAGKASVADFFGCSGPVLGELGGMEASGTWPGEMEELVRQFRAQGGRIATLGNEHDCYYDPCVCFLLLCPLFVDETMTQVIPNADDPQLYRLGSDESWGHRDILSDTTIANFMASFIGPP